MRAIYAWCELFDAATSAFESEGLDKVILASREKIEVFKDFWSVTIQAQSPFSFVFSPEENLAFFGVSPESLYRKLNGETTCDALAGTRLRGQEKDQDLELIEELLQSKKDRDEHQLVVDFLQQRMKTFCKDVYVSETGVKTLNHLFHLHTIVQGKGAKEGNVLSHLHPTPALSGSPQGHAISFLRKNESFDRGHYGGAIGIIERDFESFSVAIRSVLQRRDEAFVFFGAGVIPSSCCEEEWTEILAKRDAILANLEYSQGKK